MQPTQLRSKTGLLKMYKHNENRPHTKLTNELIKQSSYLLPVPHSIRNTTCHRIRSDKRV